MKTRKYEVVRDEIISMNHYLMIQLDNANPNVIDKIRKRINLLITEALECKKGIKNEKV